MIKSDIELATSLGLDEVFADPLTPEQRELAEHLMSSVDLMSGRGARTYAEMFAAYYFETLRHLEGKA